MKKSITIGILSFLISFICISFVIDSNQMIVYKTYVVAVGMIAVTILLLADKKEK